MSEDTPKKSKNGAPKAPKRMRKSPSATISERISELKRSCQKQLINARRKELIEAAAGTPGDRELGLGTSKDFQDDQDEDASYDRSIYEE